MKDAPSQSQDKFIVRLPDGMRDRIKAAADAAGRSMNAEIVHRLEISLAGAGAPMPDDYIERLGHIELAMRGHLEDLRKDLAGERALRAKLEDTLLRERLKEAD